jgi:hypothetical protein
MKNGKNMHGEYYKPPSSRFGLKRFRGIRSGRTRGGGTSRGINNLCTACLRESLKKQKFAKLLARDQYDELNTKVERQVCLLETYSLFPNKSLVTDIDFTVSLLDIFMVLTSQTF